MNTINKIIKNPYIIFILFIFCLTLQNYLFCILYTAENLNPWLTDQNGNYVLSRISFGFGQYLEALIKNQKISLDQFGFDLSSSRRPLLPYTLLFIYENFTNNFILIHLIKNLFFGSIIFFVIKNFNKEYNNLFLIFCLIFIFYIPHNAVTNLGTENEEGILNYLIVILFFLLNSNFRYKSFLLTISLCLIFFLKGSMFLLVTLIPLIIFFNDKNIKLKYLPIIGALLVNIYWGFSTMKTSGFFAIGPKSSSMNAINLATITHPYFNITYPEIRPDIHIDLVENKVLKLNIKNEKDLIDILLKDSNNYILSNPKDYAIGVLKKIYVLTLSPFKDSQYPKDPEKYLDNLYKGKKNDNEKIINPIRYSNFPNKIIFNISLIVLFLSLVRYYKNPTFINRLDIYYFFILLLYLAPYMFAWIYPRHGTSLYIISHFYLFIQSIERDFFNFKKLFKG